MGEEREEGLESLKSLEALIKSWESEEDDLKKEIKDFLERYGAREEKEIGNLVFRKSPFMPDPEDKGFDLFLRENPKYFEMLKDLVEFLEEKGLVPVIKINDRGPIYTLWVGVPPEKEEEIRDLRGLRHGSFVGFMGLSLVKLLPQIAISGELLDPGKLGEWFIHIDNVQSDIPPAKLPRRYQRRYLEKKVFVDKVLGALEEWIRERGVKYGIKGISWAHLEDLGRRGAGMGRVAESLLARRRVLQRSPSPSDVLIALADLAKRGGDWALEVLREIDSKEYREMKKRAWEKYKEDPEFRKKLMGTLRKKHILSFFRRYYIDWPRKRGFSETPVVIFSPFHAWHPTMKYDYGMEEGRLGTKVWLKRLLP